MNLLERSGQLHLLHLRKFYDNTNLEQYLPASHDAHNGSWTPQTKSSSTLEDLPMILQFIIDFEEAGNIDHRLFLRGRALRDEWFPNWEDLLRNQRDNVLSITVSKEQ